MATMSTPFGKIKLDFIEPTTGEKFSEEPFYMDLNICDPSNQSYINTVNDNINALFTLSGASCTAKHVIYDQTLTD